MMPVLEETPPVAPSPAPCLPLPRVPGPRLAPFTPTGHADIEFIQRLSPPNAKDGYVWEVEILGKTYALKMFDLVYWKGLRTGQGRSLRGELTKPQFYLDYFDPFSCECRVYGRLKDEGREDLAVRAHGYLFLTPAQEDEVRRMLAGEVDSENESEGSELDGEPEQDCGEPVRAIVKDLVNEAAFKDGQIPQMWSDLKDLHALGILVRDIHIGNYLDGKFVDFSRAWTMYHPCLDGEGGRAYAQGLPLLQRKDVSDLEDMIDMECGYSAERPDELNECAGGKRECGKAPHHYNWKEKDGDEAVAHVDHELYGDEECCSGSSEGEN